MLFSQSLNTEFKSKLVKEYTGFTERLKNIFEQDFGVKKQEINPLNKLFCDSQIPSFHL